MEMSSETAKIYFQMAILSYNVGGRLPNVTIQMQCAGNNKIAKISYYRVGIVSMNE